MEKQQIKQIVMKELPIIMQDEPEVQRIVLNLSRKYFADKQETESRFDRVLNEIREMRIKQDHKWEENQRELREMRIKQDHKWEENQRELREMRIKQDHKWEENQRELREMREEQARKWDENQRELREMREEQARKWDENMARQDQRFEALMNKYNSSIGALGARWGLHTEQSFRNALAGILEDIFGVEVRNVTEFDDEGEVFGRPDQVELDIIIQDGILIICEIKSAMSKSDMYIFSKKVRFYEKRHDQKADRILVVSPMVDRWAQKLAQELGIEIYSYATDIELDSFA